MGFLEYAPAPESAAILNLKAEYGLFIDGDFVESRSGRTFATTNPATEEHLADVAEGSKDDVDRAVAAARNAYEGHWGALSGRERGKYMFRIARQIQERARQFAVLETIDGGKPIRESRDVDIPLSAAWFFYYAGWADKYAQVAGNANPVAGPYFNISVPEPTGVVAIIAPQ